MSVRAMVSEMLPLDGLSAYFETVARRCLQACLARALGMPPPRPFSGHKSPGVSGADTSLVDLYCDARATQHSGVKAEVVRVAIKVVRNMTEAVFIADSPVHAVVQLKVSLVPSFLTRTVHTHIYNFVHI